MMQASSPLAALQPQQHHFGHNRWNLGLDVTRSGPPYGQDFNFRDLSMHHVRPQERDYFNVKSSLRGSSPAASLAVDLSQNFHIDKSPLPPTPRRSWQSIFGTVGGKEPMSTPPATSPCPDIEMDMSPLPHKPAFLSAQIMVQSPSPDPSPMIDEDDMTISPIEVPESPLETFRIPERERKSRPAPLRPSLTRTKAHSSGQLSMKSAGLLAERPLHFSFQTHPPPTLTSFKPTPLMTLDEAFMESPGKENSGKMSIDSTPVAPRPRSANQMSRLFGSPLPLNGSPMMVRRPGAVSKRPCRGVRRSNSMFEHPDNWDKGSIAEASIATVAELEFDSEPEYLLPNFMKPGEAIPRINQNTMVDVLDGKYSAHYDNVRIIDCRFEYEYSGGHIAGAENSTDREGFAATYLASAPTPGHRTLLIFHCEFSEMRAPETAKHFRAKDRTINILQYPKLSCPEVYILDGGYSSFFKMHKDRCWPQTYTMMEDSKHSQACERGLGKMKQHRGKLSRAHTFTMGEKGHDTFDNSPTAQPRDQAVLNRLGMEVCRENSSMSLHGVSDLGAPPRMTMGKRTISC